MYAHPKPAASSLCNFSRLVVFLLDALFFYNKSKALCLRLVMPDKYCDFLRGFLLFPVVKVDDSG